VEGFVDDARDDVQKNFDNQNSEYSWEDEFAKIYSISDTNFLYAIQYSDSVLGKSENLDNHNREKLLWIKGEFCYEIDSILSAQEAFNEAKKYAIFDESPRHLIYEAACFVLLNEKDKSLDLINKAIDQNEDMYWYLGNYYEIQNDKRNAIKAYSKMAGSHPAYKHHQDRIDELNASRPFFTKFAFRFSRLDFKMTITPL
jgi:tetratricopeptide (TPR) repeat protein